jgi:hypothetical protein
MGERAQEALYHIAGLALDLQHRILQESITWVLDYYSPSHAMLWLYFEMLF